MTSQTAPVRAFFGTDGERFTPLPYAQSLWSADMVTGTAVCGLLARGVETEHGTDGFRPARLTVDLFRPVRMSPVTVETSVVRQGSRIHVIDATMFQNGEATSRASAVFLAESEEPPGAVWMPDHHRPVPADASPDPAVDSRSFFGSGESPGKWSSTMAEHQGDGRKRMWTHQLDIVAGETTSPFVRAAISAETTSLMTNWGSEGVNFINVDLTLSLARLPVGHQIGIEADDHVSFDGIGVGTATLYDRNGAYGKGTVSAVANALRTVQFDKGPMPHLKA